MGGLIWLASYPKSGNTWARSFLHNLLLDSDKPADINELTRFCISEPAAAHYHRRLAMPWKQVTTDDVMKVRAAVQADFTFASSDSVFVKTHNYLGEWRGRPLINMNVTAGAIYLVRNPLDVVLSASDHFGLSTNDAILMMADPTAGNSMTRRNVAELYTSWSNHVKSWTEHPSPQLLVMRYEDMLESPEIAFRNVARFLGLDPPADRLARAIENSSFKTLKAVEEERGFAERSPHAKSFFRKGQSGQWREHLTDAQIRRIISDHSGQMKRFGYIPEDYA